jgi:hypothetical protein
MTRVKQHLSLLSMCQLCNITTSHDRITLNDFPILWTAQPKPVLLKPSIMDEITHKIRSRDESSFVSSSIDSSEWLSIKTSSQDQSIQIVGAKSGILYISLNSGLSWSQISTSPIDSPNLCAILDYGIMQYVQRYMIIVIPKSASLMYTSDDFGRTWTSIPLNICFGSNLVIESWDNIAYISQDTKTIVRLIVSTGVSSCYPIPLSSSSSLTKSTADSNDSLYHFLVKDSYMILSLPKSQIVYWTQISPISAVLQPTINLEWKQIHVGADILTIQWTMVVPQEIIIITNQSSWIQTSLHSTLPLVHYTFLYKTSPQTRYSVNKGLLYTTHPALGIIKVQANDSHIYQAFADGKCVHDFVMTCQGATYITQNGQIKRQTVYSHVTFLEEPRDSTTNDEISSIFSSKDFWTGDTITMPEISSTQNLIQTPILASTFSRTAYFTGQYKLTWSQPLDVPLEQTIIIPNLLQKILASSTVDNYNMTMISHSKRHILTIKDGIIFLLLNTWRQVPSDPQLQPTMITQSTLTGPIKIMNPHMIGCEKWHAEIMSSYCSSIAGKLDDICDYIEPSKVMYQRYIDRLITRTSFDHFTEMVYEMNELKYATLFMDPNRPQVIGQSIIQDMIIARRLPRSLKVCRQVLNPNIVSTLDDDDPSDISSLFEVVDCQDNDVISIGDDDEKTLPLGMYFNWSQRNAEILHPRIVEQRLTATRDPSPTSNQRSNQTSILQILIGFLLIFILIIIIGSSLFMNKQKSKTSTHVQV